MLSLKIMIKFIFVVLLLVFLKSLLLSKTYHLMPITELRRRARGKDKKAAEIYRVAVFGPSLDLLLWVFGAGSAAGMVLLAARATWWTAFLVGLAAAWLATWLPKAAVDGWVWNFVAWSARYVAPVLAFCRPVLEPLARLMPKNQVLSVHTGLYSKEDLLALINNQNHQLDNRIPEDELAMAYGTLTFGEKTAGDVMTPRRTVRWVAADEAVGPVLMDELHKAGYSRFPVVKDVPGKAEPYVIGTLYLKDLVGREEGGHVRDLMDKKVFFANEAQNLHSCLAAFLKTHHHLLVVVNNFEEVVGVLTLEDVLEQIIGHKIVDEFDQYEDMRAVAGRQARQEKAHHEPIVEAEK